MDIDTDIEDALRGKVLDYVRFKYGKKKVANIITFGTAAAKNSIKTINRVLGYSVTNGDSITKLIPEKPGMTIEAALEDKDFKDLYNSNSDAKKIIDLALKIEGLKTSQSIHPCFVAGTQVLTKSGNKSIEKISVGDEVITHTGKIQKVVKTMKRTTTDRAYRISALNSMPVTCTYNHPFLVKERVDARTKQLTETAKWVDAEKLIPGVHYVGVPTTEYNADYKARISSESTLKAYCIVEDGYIWIPVAEVKELDQRIRNVYNLEVENDNSYIANNMTVHNCASVVTDDVVTNYMPEVLMEDPETEEKVWVTQMEGPTCEELGCLKMDFLGLRTLGYVHETLNSIEKNTGKKIDYEKIPLNDMTVYKSLAQGNTASIFQCESDMFTTVIRKTLKDTLTKDCKATGEECFERLVAMNALVRPGSNVFIDEFADDIMHPENAKYLVPELKPILKETYGIILYQEQTMRITRDLAGFSAGQADTVRKALG